MDDQRAGDGSGERRELPGERRPERQLERPPSERYRDVEPALDEPSGGSRWRGVVMAAIAALIGAVAIAVAGGKLTITAGLLVIAAVIGWIIAGLVALGADPTTGRTTRRLIATILALVAVAAGQIGLWIIARQEGGTLGVIDYLAEVFGLLVPLELLLAGGMAWWRTA